jgi:predicted nuclease of restriction endonuclease-like RecB superfamily
MTGPYRICDDLVVAEYFQDTDRPWLRCVLDEYARFVDRPRRELRRRWSEPLPVPCPPTKRRLVIAYLDRLGRDRTRTFVPPRRIRETVFLARAAHAGPRHVGLETAAGSLGMTPDVAMAFLFADLPEERSVGLLPGALTPTSLIPLANLEVVQFLLRRTVRLTLSVDSQSRTLIRAARLRGLICAVHKSAPFEPAVLSLSGPLAVIRHSTLYGRALAGLARYLPECGRYHLHAKCLIDGQLLIYELRAGEVDFPGLEPRHFDSRLEERFHKDFQRLAPDWDILREPEPVEAGRHLIFPDFLLRHRHDPERQWWLEIVGFWTPQYLEKKLAGLRQAGLRRIILCVDADRACSEEELPRGAELVRFRRRIDVAEVLAVMQA